MEVIIYFTYQQMFAFLSLSLMGRTHASLALFRLRALWENKILFQEIDMKKCT